VALALGVDGVDLVAPLEREHHELLEAIGHRRRMRVGDHQHALRARGRRKRLELGQALDAGGMGGDRHGLANTATVRLLLV
jgi:hypothetical protein